MLPEKVLSDQHVFCHLVSFVFCNFFLADGNVYQELNPAKGLFTYMVECFVKLSIIDG